MSVWLISLVALTLALVGVLLWFRTSPTSGADSPRTGRGVAPGSRAGPRAEKGHAEAAHYPYRGAMIVPGARACKAAIRLDAMRFLSAEVPKLPLEDCDAAQCTCRYRHFKERRQGERRHVFSTYRQMGLDGTARDRRRNPGRRSSDHAH